MRYGRFLVWLSMLLLLSGCAHAEGLPMPTFQGVSVHDPSVIKADDGYYYIYGSHMAAARSKDLVQWKLISSNAQSGCTLVDNVQLEMKDALTYARTNTFWAPDVQQLPDGRYYLYYCCCQGSSPLSALGVAVSDKPEGPYKDLGVFLRSGMAGYNATYYPNVIDPNVFFDKNGKLWMVYGSYSGGIFILSMNPETGFPYENQGYGKKLLGKNHARIEGPYILYSPDSDYYYLFLSFGGLNANDGYNIRVCRSKNPDGPYEDALGQDMIACGGRAGTFFNDPDYVGYGVKLMGGYCFKALAGEKYQLNTAYRSPGHNSAYYDAETGRYFIIFHTRFANSGETFTIRVHEMFINADGWPVVSPLRYAGEGADNSPPAQCDGVYKVLFHERDINKVEHVSSAVSLLPDGTVSGAVSGAWTCDDNGQFTLSVGEAIYNGVMRTAYDASQKQWATCFTALDATGAAVWGIRAALQ